MYVIQTNESGTRSITVTDEHFNTIEKYSLFQGLIDSNGIVDEDVLDKLKLNVRSLLESSKEIDSALLSLCFDVLYHQNMKAYGLHGLILQFVEWKEKQA